MSDIISRADLFNALATVKAPPEANEYKAEVYTVIQELPSAEAVQGEWIDRSDGGRVLNPWWESHKCDQCGYCGSGAWNFCPNCGARMLGEDDKE